MMLLSMSQQRTRRWDTLYLIEYDFAHLFSGDSLGFDHGSSSDPLACVVDTSAECQASPLKGQHVQIYRLTSSGLSFDS